MSDSSAKKVKAVGKIVYGAARVVGGVVTGAGHGLLGTYLRNHKMRSQAMILGKHGVESGMKTFKQGMREFDEK